MTNGTIKIEFTGSGYKVFNGGGEKTFSFLCGLQKRGLFHHISHGPNHLANWIEKDRLEKFTASCEKNGFNIARS
jgi:hypothetical protein